MRLTYLGNLQVGYTGSLHPTESFYRLAITGSGTSGSVNLNNILYVSGSIVSISGSLTLTGGITGSLLGTASFATTSSYALTSAGGSGGISQGKVVAIAIGYSNLF
jgi:hypothetical protein